MKKPVFEGVGTAIVTPFQNGTIDYAVYDRLLNAQLAAGVDAIIVAGTTGESATLSDAEKLSLLAHTIQFTAGRCKVIAGTGSNDTAHSLELSRVACSMGADAVLLVTPYYNKCTQEGLVRHFCTVADGITCPAIVYNVPSRTGMDIRTETCIRLSEHPNLNGVKEACGDVAKAADVIRACGEEFFVWSGNDDQTVPLMSVGAKGVISVLSNVLPTETLQMTHAGLHGDFKTAGKLQLRLMPLIRALFAEVNPIPVKAALELQGFAVGDPRLPLTPAEEKTVERLRELMTA